MRTIIIDADCFFDLIKHKNNEFNDVIGSAIIRSEINWKNPKDFVWTEDTEIIVNVKIGRASSLTVYHCHYDYHDYYNATEKLLSCGDHEISLEKFKEWGNNWIEKVI